MNKLLYYIAIVLASLPILFMNYALAATINCSGTTGVGGDYAVPPVNVTAPNTGESSKLLYSVNNATIQPAYSNCIAGGAWVNTAHTLTDIPPGDIYTINGYTVYPTNIKGLGVSIKKVRLEVTSLFLYGLAM